MRAVGLGLLLSLLLSLLLTPIAGRVALWLKALDPFSARKLLRPSQVPRLGGVAIAITFYLTVALLWSSGSVVARATLQQGTPVLPILLGGVPMLLLGIVDDLRGLRALPKLLVEIVVALFLYGQGLRVLGTSGPTGPIELSQLLSALVTVAWIVGVVNAVNLIDGLDGLASGVAVIALGTTTVAALLRGDLLLAFVAGSLAGATLGFLRYNFNPASIFMGDSGSLFLGYLLATMSIWSVRKSATAVLVVFPVVALGLPLLDTGLTISRRFLAGRPVMQADRDHVHHRLLLMGLPVRRAVLWLYAACLVFGVLSLLMVLGGPLVSRIGLTLAVGFALLLGYLLGYLRGGPQGLWAALSRRSRTQQLLRAMDELSLKLPGCQTLSDVESQLAQFGQLLGFSLRLKLETTQIAAMRELSDGFPVVMPGKQGRLLGYLCVDEPSHTVNPDERTLIGLLCDSLGPTLGRVVPSDAPRA